MADPHNDFDLLGAVIGARDAEIERLRGELAGLASEAMNETMVLRSQWEQAEAALAAARTQLEQAERQIALAGGYHARTQREVEIAESLEGIEPRDLDSSDEAIAYLLTLVDAGRNRVYTETEKREQAERERDELDEANNALVGRAQQAERDAAMHKARAEQDYAEWEQASIAKEQAEQRVADLTAEVGKLHIALDWLVGADKRHLQLRQQAERDHEEAARLVETLLGDIKQTEQRVANLERILTDEKAEHQTTRRRWIDEAVACIAERQRVAELEAKIAEFEKRPWPGCRRLSQGDACTCSLCMTERRVTDLTDENKLLRPLVTLIRLMVFDPQSNCYMLPMVKVDCANLRNCLKTALKE